MSKRGFFITLEGPDGCGKTTQAGLAVRHLRARGLDVVHTREPGGTSFAENLRKILLDPRHAIFSTAELLLYEASRAQHTEEVIRPALKSGKIVFCERYTDATMAYQGYGRGLDLSAIRKLNAIATAGLLPDLTVVLDIPSREGLARLKKDRKRSSDGKGDRMEREALSFHDRVRKGYYALASREPFRIKMVSARGSVAEVGARLCGLLDQKLARFAGEGR